MNKQILNKPVRKSCSTFSPVSSHKSKQHGINHSPVIEGTKDVNQGIGHNFNNIRINSDLPHSYSKKNAEIQPKLKIGKPNDKYEQEADKVASMIVDQNSFVSDMSLAGPSEINVQRQEKKKKTSDEEKYKEAAKKTGEAFLETPIGKTITDKAKKLGEDFISTLPGKIVAGTAAAGAVGAIVAKNGELPMQIPAIPLDKVTPGLSMKITYNGPVRNPTDASIAFSYQFGGGKKESKKPAKTNSEKLREGNARMAEDQRKFRESMKTQTQKEEDEAFMQWYIMKQTQDPASALYIPGMVPKKETPGSEEKKKEEEIPVQRKEANSAEHSAGRSAGIHNILKSPGKPMDNSTRAMMEGRFGHDFRNIRIHTDANAGLSARLINAHAFTSGKNIVFAPGKFNADSKDGQRLLAHELTHVIQQGQAKKSSSNESGIKQTSNLNIIQRKEGTEKTSTADTKKALKAQKLVWDDLRAFFPNDIGKVAGTGYREEIDSLETIFGEEKAEGVSTSAPIIMVGKNYFSESDVDKRMAILKKEVGKIDEWRFNQARLDNNDLKNADIKAKLQDMSAQAKLSYAERLKAQKYIENDQVVEYIKKVMQSTPIVEGATARAEGGFEVQFDNIKIIVLPDVYNSSEVSTGAETQIKTVPENPTWYNSPGYTWDGAGKIKSMTFIPTVPDIVYTVQTHYSSGSNPRDTSGYGAGTRPEDTTPEEKTLGFHEGAHGEEFIKSIKAGTATTKFPEYTGKVEDERGPFVTAHNTWRENVSKFKAMVDKALEDNIQIVDCSGKTITKFHKEKGTSTTVHCNP